MIILMESSKELCLFNCVSLQMSLLW